jgi:hypothetical protein
MPAQDPGRKKKFKNSPSGPYPLWAVYFYAAALMCGRGKSRFLRIELIDLGKGFLPSDLNITTGYVNSKCIF